MALRRTTALSCSGVIGWHLRQSWFQRRRGLATLVATTAAGSGYQERMSPRDHDKTFSASDATGATAEVAYKKRPFGILRYSPGKDNIGSMVMEIIPKSRYPGDPQGQAFAAGVTSGRVLKSINGKDASGMEFAHIMDLLDDEVMDQRMSQHGRQ